MNIKRSTVSMAAATLLMLAAGCGGTVAPAEPPAGSPVSAPMAASAAPSAATACELLTVQDVQTVLGLATTTRATTPTRLNTTCAYLAGGGAARALYVTLGRSGGMSPAQMVSVFESDGPGATAISDLGEAAVYVPSAKNPNASGGELVFALRRADQTVLVNLSTFRTGISKEQFVALARIAAQRV